MTISDPTVVMLTAEVKQPSSPHYRELAEKTLEKGLEYAGGVITGILKPGSEAWMNSQEGRAARQKAKMLKTCRAGLPGHQRRLDGVLDSGIAFNKTATSSVKEITDRFERLSNAHVEAAGSLQRSAKGIESVCRLFFPINKEG